VQINSSAISSADYKENTKELTVVFRQSGKTYTYSSVPQDVWDQFQSAASQGSYFNANIKNNYSFV